MAKRKQEVDPFISDVKAVLSQPAGRRFIWHILSSCELYSMSSLEAGLLAFQAGKRSIGLEILGLLEEVDPSEYPKLCLELGAKTYERTDNDTDGSDSDDTSS